MKTIFTIAIIALFATANTDYSGIAENNAYYEQEITLMETKVSSLEHKIAMMGNQDENELLLTQGMIMKYNAAIACYERNMK